MGFSFAPLNTEANTLESRAIIIKNFFLIDKSIYLIYNKAVARKCRNWQTSKTKDLVTIAVVWVQVPSSAFLIKWEALIRGFPFFVLFDY